MFKNTVFCLIILVACSLRKRVECVHNSIYRLSLRCLAVFPVFTIKTVSLLSGSEGLGEGLGDVLGEVLGEVLGDAEGEIDEEIGILDYFQTKNDNIFVCFILLY